MNVNLLICLIIAVIVLVFFILSRKKGNNKWNLFDPRLYNKNLEINCPPNPHPILAQLGHISNISRYTPNEEAKRKFLLYNNSDLTMKVVSLTFGGYNLKFDGQVVEMINNLEGNNAQTVIPPGGIFSLGKDDDEFLMTKGWYNGPIFIAYTLYNPDVYDSDTTEDTQKTYEIIGWMPKRLQDEKSQYVNEEGKEYELIRDVTIQWETGNKLGDAKPLGLFSDNGQCKYYTKLMTFEPINVRVSVCHLKVVFGDTTYLSQWENLKNCLKDISTLGSMLIMNGSKDIPNFIEKIDIPDFIKDILNKGINITNEYIPNEYIRDEYGFDIGDIKIRDILIHGKSGRKGYASKQKLWVNSEFKKGKLHMDARCAGAWEISYLK